MTRLKSKLSSIGWNGLASSLFTVFQIITYFIFARTIGVDALGQFALAFSLVLFPLGIFDQSTYFHLIQKKSKDQGYLNSIFIFGFLIAFFCTLIYLIMWSVLKDGQLLKSSLTVSIPLLFILFLNPFIVINKNLLKSECLYKKIAILESFSSLSYLLTFFLGMALDLGIWSLIIATINKYFIDSIFLAVSGTMLYFPSIKYEIGNLKDVWHQNKYVVGERLASGFLYHFDIWVVGLIMGVSTLGTYELLKKIIIRPFLLLYQPLEEFFYNWLCNTPQNISAYSNVMKEFNKLIIPLFIVPFLLIALNASWVVSFFPDSFNSGDKLIFLISLFGSIVILLNPLDIIMYSSNRAKLFFKWIVGTGLILVVLLIITSGFGLEWYMISQIIFYLCLWILSYFILKSKDLLDANVTFEILIIILIGFGMVYLLNYIIVVPIHSIIILSLTLISAEVYLVRKLLFEE